MPELKTEPGWRPPRTARPWWAVALVTGIGAGVAIAAALGLSAMPNARGETPVRTAGMAVPTQEDRDARLSRIESKVDEALQRIAHIEGRMDRGR